MPDIIDSASEAIEIHSNASITRILSATFEKGEAGECDLCGYDFARVVPRVYQGESVKSCGGCRDLFALDT